MKKIILIIAVLFAVAKLFAQVGVVQKYAIQFKDKGYLEHSKMNPSVFLSNQCVERRLKHQVAFDKYDLPVDEDYVNQITNQGIKILSRSRWLNTVVIETTQEKFNQIKQLPFINTAKMIDNGLHQEHSVAANPKFPEVQKIIPSANKSSKKILTDVYDYGQAYNQINMLKGISLHNNGYSGQGMTIAVIDAGFNSADVMTCFDSLRANNQIKGTRDCAQPGNNVYATTLHWHGTSVLSCMRSEVAESESIIEEYYWVSAAEFADSLGADLINSSLGYTTFDDSTTNHTYADMDGNTTFITIGADMAAQKGILVVNSAGNSGADPWHYIGAPADGDSVFTIGAVDAAGVRAYFSSVGPTYDGRIKPDVCAQGLNAALFFPGGLGAGSGTSFSSPITCGITACLWQAYPDLNNMQIIDAVKATSNHDSPPDSLTGWGIPDYEMAATSLYVHNHTFETPVVTYPNPVKDKITIGFQTALHGAYTIEFIDLQGRVAYTYEDNNDSIRSVQLNDIGHLASGIYMVRVRNSSFNFTTKVIKD